MANMTTGVGISGLIVLTVLPVDGEEPLRVAVTPIHSFAPATVTIRAEDRAERRKQDARHRRRWRRLLPKR